MAAVETGSGQRELEQTLAKYKEIVSKLKTALQSARAEASASREEAQAAAAKAAASLLRAPETANTHGATEGTAFSIDHVQSSQETITVRPLCLVQLGAAGPGEATPAAQQWCLAEAWTGTPPPTPAHTADTAEAHTMPPSGHLLTRGWVSLPALQPYLSPGQELPEAHLPPHTTAHMQSQVQLAQGRLAACEEAFRRFRVQAATTARRLQEHVQATKGDEGGHAEARTRSNTAASLDSAGSGAMGAPPEHASAARAALADVKAELRLVHAELNRALAGNGESTKRAEAAEAALASTRKQLATTEDTIEAWKLRCLEAEAALGGSGGATPRKSAADQAAGGNGSNPSPAPNSASPAVQLSKLQREFAKYREQALRLLTSKSEALQKLKARVAELEGGTGGGTQPGVDNMDDVLLTASGAEYLRNVLVRYMACSDDGMKRTLEATVATILRFTPEEIRSVQAARDARGSALGMAGSMLGSLGSVFSGLGGAPPAAPSTPPAVSAPEAATAQQGAPPAAAARGAQPLGGSSLMSTLAQHEIR